jgi:hypothetical protein
LRQAIGKPPAKSCTAVLPDQDRPGGLAAEHQPQISSLDQAFSLRSERRLVGGVNPAQRAEAQSSEVAGAISDFSDFLLDKCV